MLLLVGRTRRLLIEVVRPALLACLLQLVGDELLILCLLFRTLMVTTRATTTEHTASKQASSQSDTAGT
jgi:hypothetical protein